MSVQRNGIDISHWQGNIDFSRVKQDNIDFVMIRAAAGTSEDNRFKQNIEDAFSVKIPCGVYLYSLAKTNEEARAEAEFLLTLIKPYKLHYPVAFDLEDSAQFQMSKAARTDLIETFLTIIKKAGYHGCIYSSLSWFNTMFDLDRLGKYDKWIAQWDVKKCGFLEPFQMWQYSTKGRVAGIEGYVDKNISYFDYADQKVKVGINSIEERVEDSMGEEINEFIEPESLEPQMLEQEEVQQEEVKVEITHRLTGTAIKLPGTKLYTTATVQKSFGQFCGTYWVYDGMEVNGRYRLTNSPTKVLKTPLEANICAYVKVTDIDKLLK